MTERLYKGSNDFVTNDDFVDWVLHPVPQSDLYWREFIQDNPSSEAAIEEAIFFIKNIIPHEKQLDDRKLETLWNTIRKDTVKKNHSRRFYAWFVAATIITIMGLSLLFYFPSDHEKRLTDYTPVLKATGGSNEVRLIFSDNSERTFSSNDLDIRYDKDGGIEITTENGKRSTSISTETRRTDRDKQKNTQGLTSKNREQEQLNQLVVPRGKRSSLTLSDGTRLYLNSGSRAIFPVKFSDEKRELFVDGEAYIEVAHDSKRPFFAVTDEMSVKVLGTKFNISAYPEDTYCSVVLVEGNVQAEVNSQQIVMDPNHLLVYQKNIKETTLGKTEVLPYISWKDGWLYCEKEKLREVANKLSRYYDIKIEFQDKETSELTLYGKLDLKSECEEIFKAISAIAPISCVVSDDKIIVSKKKR
jgi:hypothetical protein